MYSVHVNICSVWRIVLRHAFRTGFSKSKMTHAPHLAGSQQFWKIYMKKTFTNYIWAVLFLLPVHAVLGMYLMRRTQIFMYEGMTAIHDKTSNSIDLKSYSTDSSSLTYLFISLFVLEMVFLLLALRASQKQSGLESTVNPVLT